MEQKIRFSEIPDTIEYSPEVNATLTSALSDIVDYASKHFDGSRKCKKSILQLINTVVYMIANHESFDDNWSSEDPFEHLYLLDENECRNRLGKLFLDLADVYWDIEVTENVETAVPVVDKKIESVQQPSTEVKTLIVDVVEKNDETVSDAAANFQPSIVTQASSSSCTSKEDLYIEPPMYPRFDATRVWVSGKVDGNTLVIYKTLPEIPTKQCEISVTTDVNMMSRKDLLNLYPHQTIHTRYSGLYDPSCKLPYDRLLGCILPIEGFTQEDVKENIVKYPHLFKLKKEVDGQLYNFCSTIEIDGKLYKTMEIWDQLPESKVIPRNNIDFIKDYVVRRYLLERDVLGIRHRYPMYGKLGPYLTLFTSVENYQKFNTGDVLDIARQCVVSRVEYKKSRNPIVRRLSNV